MMPAFTGGGAEKIGINLANEFAEKGYIVFLLVFNGTGPYRNQLDAKIQVVDFKCRTRRALLKYFFFTRRIKPDLTISVIRNSNIIVGLCNLLLFWNRSYFTIFREANTMHGVIALKFWYRHLYFLLMKVSYYFCDAIIANSTGTLDDLFTHRIVKNKIKCTVIGNPVIPSNFHELIDCSVSHKWFDNRHKVVLNIGRLHSQKNQGLLIKAFSIAHKKIPELRLLIIGEGEEKVSLVRVIHDLKLNSYVDILPFQQNPFPYYKHSNIFVLTSRWEGFGNVLVEAMAAGLPVLSLNCPGGPSEVLAGGKFGTLLDEKATREEIAFNIINILEKGYDSSLSKGRAKNYTVGSIASRYLDVYLSSRKCW